MIRVLAAGDRFVLTSLFADALRREVPDGLEIRELEFPWPDEPMGRVAEVDEATGTEEQMIEALDGVEVCVTQLAPLTSTILDASPALRLFCISRGGPVNANLEAATAHGVAVTFAPGRNATATAHAAGGAVVPRRQPAPEPLLLALPRAAAQGPGGGHPEAGVRPAGGASHVLRTQGAGLCTEPCPTQLP